MPSFSGGSSPIALMPKIQPTPPAAAAGGGGSGLLSIVSDPSTGSVLRSAYVAPPQQPFSIDANVNDTIVVQAVDVPTLLKNLLANGQSVSTAATPQGC